MLPGGVGAPNMDAVQVTAEPAAVGGAVGTYSCSVSCNSQFVGLSGPGASGLSKFTVTRRGPALKDADIGTGVISSTKCAESKGGANPPVGGNRSELYVHAVPHAERVL